MQLCFRGRVKKLGKALCCLGANIHLTMFFFLKDITFFKKEMDKVTKKCNR